MALINGISKPYASQEVYLDPRESPLGHEGWGIVESINLDGTFTVDWKGFNPPAPGALGWTTHSLSNWGKLIVPDMTGAMRRTGPVTLRSASPVIPTHCSGPRCGAANEWGAPANRGDLFYCGQCRMFENFR